MSAPHDERIQRFFEMNVRRNHRSLVVLIGENGGMQLPKIHKMLVRFSHGPVNNIIWCHKNDTTRRMGQEVVSQKKQKKVQVEDSEDVLSVFVKTNEVEFVEYRESERILGQTVDMVILQDFEALTPNLIATSMETARGGGAIVLLLDRVSSVDALMSHRMDIHNSIGDLEDVSPRYNKRLFRSLAESKFVLFVDDGMNVLDIKGAGMLDVSDEEKPRHVEVGDEDGLQGLSRTRDQRAVVEEIFGMLETRRERTVCSVTAPRGRGKSVALGISIAQAIHMGFLSVYVVSPAVENIKMVFRFVVEGLERLGYKKYVDFKIVYRFTGNKRQVERIELTKGRRQVVEYFSPFNELRYYPDLLVIDEAAAIPLTFLKGLLFPNLVVMATTVNGYEGTGRAFSVKLSEYLRKSSMESGAFVYKEMTMRESIRYGQDDPVERWLHRTLLLEACVPRVEGCPNPADCELFYVNKDVLFSGRSASERFLNNAFGLFISSHYKNSPNDLQVVADSSRHEIFTLLGPVEDNGEDMPSVMCSMQVSFEGRSRRGGHQREGDLIPWIVSEEHMDGSFLEKYGVRVVRMAVHPEYVSMGYGRRALGLLIEFLSRQTGDRRRVEVQDKENNILLYELDEVAAPRVEWMGVSFGVTESLHNFWARNGFLPVGMKQKVTQATGEHSGIFLLPMKDSERSVVSRYNQTFRSRFVGQLSSSFRNFSPSLCLSLLHSPNPRQSMGSTVYFAQNDVHRVRMASTGKIDISMVIDLVPDICRMYFHDKFTQELSVLKKSILLMVGCQHRSIRETADTLTLKPFQVVNILTKTLEMLVDEIQEKYTAMECQA